MSDFLKGAFGRLQWPLKGVQVCWENCMLDLEQRGVLELFFDGLWHETVIEYLESASRLELWLC